MQRTQRACEKHKKELFDLQQARKSRREAELEEARLLFQLAETDGLAFSPKENGFDFSLVEIQAYARRFHLLNNAKKRDREYRDKHFPLEIARTSGKAA